MTTPSTLEPDALVGCYRILRRLGEGGMGTVYLAYDSGLKRQVALKWLKENTLATVERLQREARLHARVEHPAVCRLYQVAGHEGHPYLVMQFIQGQPLDRIARDLNLDQILRIFISLADGLHAAHQQGLIHRDIKPSNLMVEADEAAGWRPYLLDFGLARDIGSGTLTEAGMVLGSPAYMAPEQMAGGWVDRRADVYGLGATLFECLTGRPPFQGDSFIEILEQVRTREVPRLRTLVPDMSQDMETVLEICLARDPSRRYLSAAALRDDLQRILDGVPIQARRVSLAKRTFRWMRKNRLSSALAAMVCLSMLLTGVVWIRIRQKAQAQAYWAQRFGQEIIQMDDILRFGRMLPPHDLEREFSQVRQRMEEVRARMRRDKDSEGPGHFALGEGYLLLGEPKLGRTELEAAWNNGHRSPEVSQALGNCFLELYDNPHRETLSILDAQARASQQAQIRKEFLDPAIAHLKRARRELGGLPRIEEVRFALAEDRIEDATILAHAVHKAEPWRYETLIDLAHALLRRGEEEWRTGQLKNARKTLETVLDTLDEPQRNSPSDDRIFMALSSVWYNGQTLGLRGADRRTSLEHALDAIEHALALNSHKMDLRVQQAKVLGWLGDQVNGQGGNPEPWYERAEAAIQSVFDAPRQGPSAPSALTRLGACNQMIEIHWSRATLALSRKEDVRPFVEKGLHFYQLAQTEGQADWSIYQGVAGLYSTLAEQQISRGEDCGTALERSIEALRKYVESKPDALGFDNLAGALNTLAEWKIDHGQDPVPCLKESQGILRRALDLAPGHPMTYCFMGKAALLEAQWSKRRKLDAVPALDKARRAYEKSQESREQKQSLIPVDVMYLPGLARVHSMLAEEHLARAEDAIPDAGKSLAYGRKALALKAEDSKQVRQAMTIANQIIRMKRRDSR